MRLELALIVGILFFCSWCAYIVARINSSVSAPSSQLNERQQHESPLPPPPSDRLHHLMHHQFDHQQVHPAQTLAGLPVLAGLSGAPDYVTSSSSPNQSHWRASGWPALAPADRWPGPASGLQLGPAPEEQAGSGVGPLEVAAGDEPAPEQDAGQEPLDTDQEEVAEGLPDDPDGPEQGEQGDQSDQAEQAEQGEPADQGEPPEAGQRLDELAGRRSFSELLDSERERDQNGRLLAQRRRHLVNGRPVRPAERHLDQDESGRPQASEQDKATLAGQQERDFDRLVDEIERGRKPPTNGRPAGGRDRPLAGGRPQTAGRLSEPLQRHNVRESFHQEQWHDQSGAGGRQQLPHHEFDDGGGGGDGGDESEADDESEPDGLEQPLERLADGLAMPAQTVGQPPLGRRKRHAPRRTTKRPSNQTLAGLDEPLQPDADLKVEILAPPAARLTGDQLTAPRRTHLDTSLASAPGTSKKSLAKKNANSRRSSRAKYKAAKAFEQKRKSKKKGGRLMKRKRKVEKKLHAADKQFRGSARGRKLAAGRGHKGAILAKKYHKDKGYKKRGFKKSYHKVETGDHKTYFDEFRDKDQDSKWKKFDDKHKYSKSKKWSGSNFKRHKQKKLAQARAKASKLGHWNERAKSMSTQKKGQHLEEQEQQEKVDKVSRGKKGKKKESHHQD